MANIINIDTSSQICSVALAKDGDIVLGFESAKKMDHASSLAGFVEKCLKYLKENNDKPDAVSVIIGPGSYTGLRIGLSMAKGLAFGEDIPLIALSSLKVMAAEAIFKDENFSGNELIVPMMDARRMEVYTSVLDSALNYILPETAMILNESSFNDLANKERILFIGDGIEKFKDLYSGDNAVWIGPNMPHAKYMVPLSEKYFRERRFADLAYTVPSYLKEYMTTESKKRL